MGKLKNLNKDLDKLNEDLKPMSEMANVQVDETGLPVVIWIEERSDTPDDRHGPRMKVMTHFGKWRPSESVSVTISRNPEVMGKRNLDIYIFNKVKEFIALNYDLLWLYWEHGISTTEIIKKFIKVS